MQLAGSIDLNSGSIEDAIDNPSGSGGSVALVMVTGLENVNVDTIPPTLSITSSPHISISNEMTYETSGNCGDDNQGVTVALTDSNGTSIAASPVPICNSGIWSSGQMDVSSLLDGEVTITVNHSDMAGNAAMEQFIVVDKDGTAPIVTIDTLVAVTPTNEDNFPLSGTCSEGGVAVTVGVSEGVLSDAGPSCQSGTPGTWSTSVDLSELSAGNYTVAASQADNVGNTGAAAQQDIVKPEESRNIALKSLSLGLEFSCVLDGGEVRCWGRGNYGQLGNGSSDDQSYFVTVVNGDNNPLDDIIEISGGSYHTCALQSNGRVWCWGRGGLGQLGHDGSGAKQSNAVQVHTDSDNTVLSGIVHISLNGDHSCALKSNGRVWCWGKGTQGQLGNGGSSDQNYPVAVESSADVPQEDIVQLGAGRNHTCALKSDGQVLCWGNQRYGILGNGNGGDTYGDFTTRPSLVKLNSGDDPEDFLDDIVRLGIGNEHSCVLKSDKKVWCWGRGRYDKFGNGNDTDQVYAIAVQSDLDVIQVQTGRHHTCGILENRTVHCWGRGNSGQLGHGQTPEDSSGVSVSDGMESLSNITQISLGGWHACGISASEGILCWGAGGHGRLGNGSTTNQSLSVSVIADSTASPPTPLTVDTYQRSYDCILGGSSCALNSIELSLEGGTTSPSSESDFNFNISGMTTGETLAIYSDADCETQVGNELTADGPVSITSLETDGLYSYYFRTRGGSNIAGCSESFLSYVYDSSLK